MVDILAAGLGAAAGFLSGGFASIAAPWAQWGVETQRLKRAERAARVARLYQAAADPNTWRTRGDSGRINVVFLADYNLLRPHMSTRTVNLLEQFCPAPPPSLELDEMKRAFLHDVAVAARKWRVD